MDESCCARKQQSCLSLRQESKSRMHFLPLLTEERKNLLDASFCIAKVSESFSDAKRKGDSPSWNHSSSLSLTLTFRLLGNPATSVGADARMRLPLYRMFHIWQTLSTVVDAYDRATYVDGTKKEQHRETTGKLAYLALKLTFKNTLLSIYLALNTFTTCHSSWNGSWNAALPVHIWWEWMSEK